MKNLYKTLFFILLWHASQLPMYSQSVAINEILSSNTFTNTDENGSHEDWVELYNFGATAVNLEGFGLSDDTATPYKWVFPNVTLQAGQYLLVWCSDKNRRNPSAPLHTNFKLSASGEDVVLTSASGSLVDIVPAIEMTSDVSYGRTPNGTGSFLYFNTVTPGAANSAQGFNELLQPPGFSHAAGFYTENFTLTLSTTVAGATILYTIDGSEPDASHLGGTTYQYKNQYPEDPGQATGPLLTQSFETLTYTQPLPIGNRTQAANKISMISSTLHFVPYYLPEFSIFKGTVVRAKVIKEGALPSKTISRSYFVTPLGASRFSLPVVSISISEDKLYDYNDGIYVAGVDFDTWRANNPTVIHHGIENKGNFYRRGIENEREANFSYFVNGEQVINQNVGIRLHGGSSREWQNKSIKFYARAEYGDATMDYPFFPNQPTNFDRLLLRNSGADFYETLFRDAFIHKAVKNLHVLIKDYQPTITFLNGEYWGILNLRDKFDNNYFKRVYNIGDGEIDITANFNTVEEGTNAHWSALYSYINNNSLVSESTYNYVKTQLDYESFADYYILNIFFQNIDWPGNNVARWRKRVAFDPNAPFGHDGRWRWLAHDLDATFATRSHNIALNSLANATATNGPSWPNPAWSTLMLRKMLENESFKLHFINRFADLMNTTFLSDRLLTMMNQMRAVIQPEMPEQIARWDAPSAWDWNNYLTRQANFINQRPAFQRQHIREKWEIASEINTTVDVSDHGHGFVKINTIELTSTTDGVIQNPYPWTGVYFSNVPVTLKAIANPGYEFSHWEGYSASTDDQITVSAAASFSIKAVFTERTSPIIDAPVYFWMIDSNLANDTPLETIGATFTASGNPGLLTYQSALTGYPFTSDHPMWRKASMERRNAPTAINYIPEANYNIPFATSNMRGLQIKEPFASNGNQSALIFSIPTNGYKDIKFGMAAMNEQSNATALLVDYATNAGDPQWTTVGMSASSFPLSGSYQPIAADFSAVTTADDNPDFKVRIRFAGNNLEADNGNRVTFNNFSARGTALSLNVNENPVTKIVVYPNPFTDALYVDGINSRATYIVYAVDGRRMGDGEVIDAQIPLKDLKTGIYLLRIKTAEGSQTVRIIKK
jgi:hypothetical protein